MPVLPLQDDLQPERAEPASQWFAQSHHPLVVPVGLALAARSPLYK